MLPDSAAYTKIALPILPNHRSPTTADQPGRGPMETTGGTMKWGNARPPRPTPFHLIVGPVVYAGTRTHPRAPKLPGLDLRAPASAGPDLIRSHKEWVRTGRSSSWPEPTCLQDRKVAVLVGGARPRSVESNAPISESVHGLSPGSFFLSAKRGTLVTCSTFRAPLPVRRARQPETRARPDR